MMLVNDAQCARTRQLAHEWEEAVERIKKTPTPDDEREALLVKVQVAAMASQIEDFRHQVADYEQLKSGKCRRFEFHDVAGLLTALVKARIATGVSQAELAAALDIDEVQLQRYEDKEYQTAPLGVILNAADLLGVRIEGGVELGEGTRIAEATATATAAELSLAPTPELVATE